METYQVLRLEPLQFGHIDLNLHVNCILLLQCQENTNPEEKMKDIRNIIIFTNCEPIIAYVHSLSGFYLRNDTY